MRPFYFPVSNTGVMPVAAAEGRYCRVIYRDGSVGYNDIYGRRWLWDIDGDENDIIAWYPAKPIDYRNLIGKSN